jgi:hypothetical protein
MRVVLSVLFIAFCITTKAQLIDTFNVLLHKRPSIDARLESRYSFINNNAIKVSGVRLGVSFKRKLRFGVGYSWLNTDVKEPILITDAFGTSRYTNIYFKFGYVCYYADFVFHKTKRWQLSVPIQVGTGMYWHQYNNGLQNIKSKKRLLLFYEPGITVQFKIFKWCGLGLDVCGRLALRNTNYVGEKLNSFVIAPKLLIWFDQLFYSAAPNSKITEKYGPAQW